MNKGFSGSTILKRIDSKYYELISFLSYENSEIKVSVGSGFVTDGASIPRIFWSIIGCPFSGKYVGSAILHDALFKSHALSEKDTNKIFLEMLKDNNVNVIKRNLMYLAVKIYSKFYFNKVQNTTINYYKKFVTIENTGGKNAFRNF